MRRQHQQCNTQLQLSMRLHPKDPRLEDLSTAAEYPHRFNTRPEGNPDQVGCWHMYSQATVVQLHCRALKSVWINRVMLTMLHAVDSLHATHQC
jgi:hypothetical protein